MAPRGASRGGRVGRGGKGTGRSIDNWAHHASKFEQAGGRTLSDFIEAEYLDLIPEIVTYRAAKKDASKGIASPHFPRIWETMSEQLDRLRRSDLDRSTLSEEDIWARAMIQLHDALQDSADFKMRDEWTEQEDIYAQYHQLLVFVNLKICPKRQLDLFSDTEKARSRRRKLERWQKEIKWDATVNVSREVGAFRNGDSGAQWSGRGPAGASSERRATPRTPQTPSNPPPTTSTGAVSSSNLPTDQRCIRFLLNRPVPAGAQKQACIGRHEHIPDHQELCARAGQALQLPAATREISLIIYEPTGAVIKSTEDWQAVQASWSPVIVIRIFLKPSTTTSVDNAGDQIGITIMASVPRPLGLEMRHALKQRLDPRAIVQFAERPAPTGRLSHSVRIGHLREDVPNGAWISGETFDAYADFLRDHLLASIMEIDKSKRVILPLQWFESKSSRGYGPDRVRLSSTEYEQGISGDNFDDHWAIYIPIHHANHFALMVVNPQEDVARYFDSMLSSPAPGAAEIPAAAIVFQWVQGLVGIARASRFRIEVVYEAPQQATASGDCGPMVLLMLRLLIAGVDLGKLARRSDEERRKVAEEFRYRMMAELICWKPNPGLEHLPPFVWKEGEDQR